MLGLYIASLKPENALKVIGLAFVQHNHSFMMYNNKILKPICIIVSLVIVYQAQNHLVVMIEDNDIPRILDVIKRLQYAWIPLYLFNQFCAMHFAKNYAKALEQTKEAYLGVEKSNEELNEMNQKLKNTLSLLEVKNKELNEAIKTRELFIAGVSHEFRNPLNSMMGNIELLSLDIKDPKWKEMLNTCKICGDVLLGLINNVLDVAKINAEKLELSFHSINFYRLIENAWSVSAVKIREKGLKGHLFLADNLPQYVEMDSHRLNQILLNLIGNASKFTKSGFVKVMFSWHADKEAEELRKPSHEYLSYVSKINAQHCFSPKFSQRCQYNAFEDISFTTDESPKVIETCEELGDSHTSDKINTLMSFFPTKTISHIKNHISQISFNETDTHVQAKLSARSDSTSASYSKKGAGFLKIEVFDTGCGIPASALDKLFLPFSQADSSITRRFGGTGLGLYITKQLIQKMEGEIHVYSEENAGTNFCILLPAKSVTAQEVIDSSEDEEVGNSVVKALVVDDIPLNQTVMSQYLKKMNIEVEIANNGAEAVEKFKEKGFGYYSCIFMDIQMPVMDGMTACTKIRKYEAKKEVTEDKRIPIIMVTGNCTEMEKDHCLNPEGEIKASYFFRKPFVFEECKSCVKSVLGSGGARSGSRNK
jgi:signal transduction histidine kinase